MFQLNEADVLLGRVSVSGTLRRNIVIIIMAEPRTEGGICPGDVGPVCSSAKWKLP